MLSVPVACPCRSPTSNAPYLDRLEERRVGAGGAASVVHRRLGQIESRPRPGGDGSARPRRRGDAAGLCSSASSSPAWPSPTRGCSTRATGRAPAVAFYERGLARVRHEWIGRGESASASTRPDHLYADDLDLFGRGSLFELLATARTQAGEEMLAAWLTAPAPPEEVGGARTPCGNSSRRWICASAWRSRAMGCRRPASTPRRCARGPPRRRFSGSRGRAC